MNSLLQPPGGGFSLDSLSDETLQLLRAIYRGQREGYLTLTAIHPDHKDRAPSRHLHIRDKTAVHQGLQDLLKANAQGWGAYFSVALRRERLGRWKRGGFSDLLTLTALYADLDGDLSTSFECIQRSGLGGMPAPSAMIGSGRGLHLYWLLDATTGFQTANHVLAGLAGQLGGDEVRVAQALRLPGSRNTKPEVTRKGCPAGNRACKLLWLAENRRYTLGDFAAYVPPSPEPPPLRPRAPRDIQPRLAALLTHHIPHARPFILYGKVDPKKREAVLEAQLKAGCNIFLANPKLVQTGLDLVAFPTLVFYETSYSLYVTIQTAQCKTFYPY